MRNVLTHEPLERDRGSLAHRAAEAIRTMILAKRIRGGEILSEERLA